MKFYDCFVFYNELDLLKIRLETYFDVVDYFVICECSKTLKGEDKPLFFEENKHLFEKFSSKIIHLVADNPPKVDFSIKEDWGIEYYQRNYLKNGLKNANPEDVILLCDVDEFYAPELVQSIKNNTKIPLSVNLRRNGRKKLPITMIKLGFNYIRKLLVHGIYDCLKVSPICFESDFFNYYMNYRWSKEKWRGIVFFLYKNLDTMQDIRNYRKKFPYLKRINHPIGWHFSYLGGKEVIKRKLASIVEGGSTTKTDNIDNLIDDCIKNGKSLYSWKYIQNNKLELIEPADIGFPNIEKLQKQYPDFFLN